MGHGVGSVGVVEDMGGIGREKTIIKIYCLKKIYFQLKSKS